MRILISGAGPAGLTLAKCLTERGLSPVIIEQAQSVREAGYAVGIHANGWNVAARLGLIDALKAQAMPLGRAEYRDNTGRRLFSYDYRYLARATGGKMMAIMRDALQKTLHDSIEGKAELRFGASVEALSEEPGCMRVTFACGKTETFDLVVAADGYRSGVREAWFGPHEQFLRPLGYRAAAWRLPDRREMGCSFVGYMDVDLQGGVYDVGDGTAATLFCWRDDARERIPADARRNLLDKLFSGWPDLLTGTFSKEIDWKAGFFDTICQVEAETWSRGRVVLLGDAAHCLTFLSGQGTSMAMVGAYILAQELAAQPYETAFRNYEQRLKASTEKLQQQSKQIGGRYVPRSRFGMHVQSWLLPLLTRPPLANLVAKRMLGEAIPLE